MHKSPKTIVFSPYYRRGKATQPQLIMKKAEKFTYSGFLPSKFRFTKLNAFSFVNLQLKI